MPKLHVSPNFTAPEIKPLLLCRLTYSRTLLLGYADHPRWKISDVPTDVRNLIGGNELSRDSISLPTGSVSGHLIKLVSD